MIGSRTAACLALLCALVFCAFAAQGASAAKGTTAFTCEPGSASEGFKDAHCDEATAVKAEVKFVHKEIEVGKETEVETTNEKVANKTTEHFLPVFTSTRAGTTIVISCTKVIGTGTLTNTEEAGKMHAGGTGSSHYTECKVTKPVKAEKERCTVKSEGAAEFGTVTTEKLTAKTKVISESPEEMGGELTPAGGITFVKLVFGSKAPETCPIPESPSIPVEGSIIGTAGNSPNGKGATVWFNTEAGMQKLTFGGAAATLTVATTGRMSGGGNAIAGTTTAN